MKTKIIGICVGMLMFATVLSVAAPINKNVTEVTPVTSPFAGNTGAPSVSPLSQISTLLGKTVYGSKVYPPYPCKELVSFTLDNPGTINNITNATSKYFLSGGCWANGVWWGCEYSGWSDNNSKIWKINPTTGKMTLVGPSNTHDDESLQGLAYDDTTGTMYACSPINLYTIDMLTGNATRVGSYLGHVMIGIACDSKGNLYGEEVGNPGSLYAINKTTAHISLIGHFGFYLNHCQDMAFDKDNDKLYLAALTQNGTENEGALYYCDQNTAACTKIGIFGTNLTEIDGFAIPYTSDVEINGLKGGIGVHATIKNTGTVNLSSVKWSIVLEKGLIILGKKSNGTIPSLSVGQSVDIKTGLILGFGMPRVMIKVETPDHFIEKTAKATVLSFFVLGVK